MKSLIEFVTWLLEKDIRCKNATGCLVALIAVVLFYPLARHSNWLHELERHGLIGIAVPLVVVFLVAFLTTWLIYSGAVQCRQLTIARQRSLKEVEDRRLSIRKNVESLSEWQLRFLRRFVAEHRTQIPEFEIGRFRAAWEFEVAMLVDKGIVKEHRRAGVYEVEAIYLAYLKDHWDPEARIQS